jgi:hypothetical protein
MILIARGDYSDYTVFKILFSRCPREYTRYRENILMSRDDGEADAVDVLDRPPDPVAGSNKLIAGVFDHLGKSFRDESGWEIEDGS